MKLVRNPKCLSVLFMIFIAAGLLAACAGAPQPKTYTIGLASEFPVDDILDEFKAEMAELGYTEGTNVTYIYHGELGGGRPANEAEIKSLLGQKVDLLLTLGNMPANVARNAVEGTGTPVVFVPVTDPVGEGIVASIAHPGGNVTGVQSLDPTPKAIEWLLTIAPDTRVVYTPYHASDPVALMSTRLLPDAAAQLGIALMVDEVSSGDEILAAVKTLPEGSAIFFPTSPSLDASLAGVIELATELGIPTGSTTSQDVLVSYALNLPQAGRQAAALVDKVLKGTRPGDLPVETAEFTLSIRLKMAQAIGLDISDTILRQAGTVVR